MKRSQERKLDVAEMKMLRWMCGCTRRDRVRNNKIRDTVKVVEISKKVQERRMTWYGHVMRREEGYAGRRMMSLQPPGRRRRGRPQMRWKDSVKRDL